ncbi:MAG: hypothetical protein RL701_2372 [Pseudomonadota bacterium]|jgi:PhoPQ-activated pathogenicity-related protein
MTAPIFDLERLRQNWTAPALEPRTQRDRFEAVVLPLDLGTAAQAQFAQLREHCALDFPTEREAITNYLDQIEPRLQEAVREAESVGKPTDVARAELIEMLWRLEQLLEVFLLTGRR